MIFGMIIKAENHGPDLLVWVELRGFEPLTPSMRRWLGAMRHFSVQADSLQP